MRWEGRRGTRSWWVRAAPRLLWSSVWQSLACNGLPWWPETADKAAPLVDLATRSGVDGRWCDIDGAELTAAVADVDVMVNTVPADAAAPYASTLARTPLLLDAIYDPWPTPLASAVESGGGRVISGLQMLLNQAFAQVEQFTGLPAPKEAMRAAARRPLAFIHGGGGGRRLCAGLAGRCSAAYDIRDRRLPNCLTIPGAVVILVAAAAAGRGMPAVMGAAALFAVYLVVHLLAPAAMGAGDVKLAIGIGALTGSFGVDVWALAALGAPLITAAWADRRRRQAFGIDRAARTVDVPGRGGRLRAGGRVGR